MIIDKVFLSNIANANWTTHSIDGKGTVYPLQTPVNNYTLHLQPRGCGSITNCFVKMITSLLPIASSTNTTAPDEKTQRWCIRKAKWIIEEQLQLYATKKNNDGTLIEQVISNFNNLVQKKLKRPLVFLLDSYQLFQDKPNTQKNIPQQPLQSLQIVLYREHNFYLNSLQNQEICSTEITRRESSEYSDIPSTSTSEEIALDTPGHFDDFDDILPLDLGPAEQDSETEETIVAIPRNNQVISNYQLRTLPSVSYCDENLREKIPTLHLCGPRCTCHN